MDKFSFHRVRLLLNMEWIKNRKFFMIYAVLVFVGIIVGLGLTNGMSNRYLIRNLSNDVINFLFIFGSLSWLGFSSFSFKEFHKRETALAYLQLPANSQEKFLSKTIIYIFIFPLVFGVIFYLGVNTSIWIWDNYTLSQGLIDRYFTLNYPDATPFNYITINGILRFILDKERLVFLSVPFGFLLCVGSFSTVSSLIFGRFNIFYSLILGIAFFTLCVFSVILASHLLLPDQTFGLDNAFRDDLKIMDDIPLSIFTLVALLYLSSIVFLSTVRIRLQEKEI
jgi:hypothetical protein